MKRHIILLSAFLLSSLILSCVDELEPGLDGSLPAPENLEYDEISSDAVNLSVFWDGSKAIQAGATSVTVELVKNEVGTDVNPPEQIVLTSSDINDAALFTGLTTGEKFMVRARANYTKARYSEWTWLMDGDRIGVVKVGTGLVAETTDVLQAPSMRLNWASTRQIAVNYSSTNFSFRSVDITYDYKIEVYKNEGLTDLQVALDIPAALQSTTFALKQNFFPGFVFSNLRPATDYWFRLTRYDEENDNPVSEVYKFTTLADDTVLIGEAGTAEPGQVILRENFDQLCWGGDMVNQCAGVGRTDRSSVTELSVPEGDYTGDNAITSLDANDKNTTFFFARLTGEYALFSSVGKAVRGTATSLGDWGLMCEDSQTASGNRSALTIRPGMIKSGGSSKIGTLVCPELKSLKGPATVKVKVRVCNYCEASNGAFDNDTKAIYLFNNLTFDSSGYYFTQILNNTKFTETPFKVGNTAEGYGWKDYEFTLTGVQPTSRIGIGGSRSEAKTGQNRLFIDHFSIELVSYDNITPGLDESLATPTSPELSGTTENSISVGWGGGEANSAGAISYTVQLVKDSSDPDNNPVEQTVDATEATFSSLTENDHYSVRVRANYSGDRYSNWVWLMDGEEIGVIIVGTGLSSGKLQNVPTVKLAYAATRQLAIMWSITDFEGTGDAKTKETSYDYKLEIFKNEGLSDLQLAMDIQAKLFNQVFKYNQNYPPSFVFCNLEPGTDYWVRVTCYDAANGNPASEAYKFTTLADDTVIIGAAASAEPGEVILRENFDSFCWGGDPVNPSAGICRGDRATRSDLLYPTGDYTGENAFTDTAVDGGFMSVRHTTEWGLFSEVGKAMRGSCPTLKDWGLLLNDSADGSKSALTMRAGMFKSGGSSKIGTFVCPELSCLKGTATVKVKVRICNYKDASSGNYDNAYKGIYLIQEQLKFDDTGYYFDKYLPDVAKTEKTFTVNNSDANYGWEDIEVTLTGVKPTDRIGIGGSRTNATTGQNRFWVDHFSVELVSYE